MPKPNFNVMYGLTHTLEGEPIIREPKLLKVSIGASKGAAVDVGISKESGKWIIRRGYDDGKNAPGIEYFRAESKDKASELYWEIMRNDPPVCPFPRKLKFFTFLKLNPDNTYSPDFDAIEAHGPEPTEIDVVFLDAYPLAMKYAMWSARELKCHGNGREAERVLSLAATDEEKRLAKEAADAGERYFPVLDGCWTDGCKYSKETVNSRGFTVGSPCKPSGHLKFQLANHIRVGGTAYFYTTGQRSISQVYSALWRFRMLTGGRIVGIPFKMWMRNFKTNHNNKPGDAWGVSLELRAEDVKELQEKMIAQGAAFFEAAGLPSPEKPIRAIEAAPGEGEGLIEVDDDEPLPAAAIESEFGGFEEGEEPDIQPNTDSSRMEKATAKAKSDLVQKLKGKTLNVDLNKAGPPKKLEEPEPEPEPGSQQEYQPSDDEAPPVRQVNLLDEDLPF